MTPGKFITFEGGEGAGKSTQAKRLSEKLAKLGVETHVTREPGGSPFGEALREILLSPDTPHHAPLAETLLFYAARADHLATAIRPALAAGIWVVCDRFSDSTRVYQGVAGNVPAATIDKLEELVVADTTPDLTIILDIDPAAGLERARARRMAKAPPDEPATVVETDRYESRALAYHGLLRNGFLDLARKAPDRYLVVDACQPIDDIADAIWTRVVRQLNPENR